MRTVIIDDEISARTRLRRLLGPHSDIEIVGEARDGIEAVRTIEHLHPDLLFIDIAMPGMSGFEVLHAVSASPSSRTTRPLPLVVFATGYDQHALAAFEANAVAYLLKPVDTERLAQALDRARKLHAADRHHLAEENQRVLKTAREAAPPQKPWKQIVCRKRGRAVLMQPDQIFWFQVESGIVKACADAESFTVNYQLNELEANLPQDLFFRARRELLVNLGKVREIRPYFRSSFVLIMSDTPATELVVSERQASALRQRIPGL